MDRRSLSRALTCINNWKPSSRQRSRRSKLKNKQGALVLAVFLSFTAPAFADSISAHSEGFALAERFTDQQDFQNSFARHNTVLRSVEENGARGVAISSDLDEYHFNQGASFDEDKMKIHGKRHGDFGDGNGNSNGIDGRTSVSAATVAEPGSQTLLFFGLTGLGMFVYRRNYLRAAILEQAGLS